MTHIENIPHILEHGITHHRSPNSNKKYVSIGYSNLISKREGFTLTQWKCSGKLYPLLLWRSNANAIRDYVGF